ncbi:oxidoreductase [Pseudomonas aeruginosa]|nr:oxidoreductase [Pseudomonas aeruginosa]
MGRRPSGSVGRAAANGSRRRVDPTDAVARRRTAAARRKRAGARQGGVRRGCGRRPAFRRLRGRGCADPGSG